jgi:hypothetical protein
VSAVRLTIEVGWQRQGHRDAAELTDNMKTVVLDRMVFLLTAVLVIRGFVLCSSRGPKSVDGYILLVRGNSHYGRAFGRVTFCAWASF